MAKHYAIATRDFTRTIKLGPLVVSPLGVSGFGEQEIAPAREHVLESKAGSVAQFSTKKSRDAYIAACNAENPGAVAPYVPA